MFRLLDFCCKNSYVSWLLPYLFRAVPLSDLRGCPLGLRPQKVRPIKHNSLRFFQSTLPSSVSLGMWFHLSEPQWGLSEAGALKLAHNQLSTKQSVTDRHYSDCFWEAYDLGRETIRWPSSWGWGSILSLLGTGCWYHCSKHFGKTKLVLALGFSWPQLLSEILSLLCLPELTCLVTDS